MRKSDSLLNQLIDLFFSFYTFPIVLGFFLPVQLPPKKQKHVQGHSALQMDLGHKDRSFKDEEKLAAIYHDNIFKFQSSLFSSLKHLSSTFALRNCDLIVLSLQVLKISTWEPLKGDSSNRPIFTKSIIWIL